MNSGEVKQTVRQAGNSDALGWAARTGFAVVGLMHLLIAWIALQLAFGVSGKQADQSGALQTLSSNALGTVLLWVAVVGFAGLGIWQLTQVFASHDAGDRVKAVAKGVVYLVLAWTALKFATGSGSSSQKQTSDVTASLMSKPAGGMLVIAVGLVILGVGIYHVYKGWSRKFLQDLRSHPGRAVVVLARFGYIAKGVALGVVGVLFVLAGVHNNPKEAGGLDRALRSLLDVPFGQVLLTVVALGLAAYGVYSFARARYGRV
ncbi:membrane protein [Intrasporangium chromatireducens Q5-1]|uniref:Membrane protein n=1 Tax=Intrasporangium chromatireducens Q5-1 TaxID=584657 RepID=W9GP29_9MICO|nr:DUF1206 domain-containing protein [Intrasporangium chromatireducens]EWT05644.1 membrane protein [Intrasporangium chromatireducens Q5-1]